MKTQHIPGLTLLIKRDGKVWLREAYGVANRENKRKTDIADRFDIGSIGKTFTGLLVMQLVEAGKIDLDKPVKSYLPDFPQAWEKVTVRHLLSHQSGIPDYVFQRNLALDQTYEISEWTKTMYPLKQDFEQGLMFQYSNSNYTILGMLLEKLTGKKYLTLVEDKIFGPIKLKATSYRTDPTKLPAGSATGYFWEETDFIDAGAGGISPMPSDGGAFSTVDDLATFVEAVRAGKIVSQKTLASMQAPALNASGRKTTYGLGWMTKMSQGKPVIGHGGNSVGFSSTISLFPEEKTEIYMLCNVYPVGGDEFALRLARILHPELRPAPMANQTDPNPSLSEKLKLALIELGKQNLSAEMFSPEMKARLATGRGRMAAGVFQRYAEVKSFSYVGSRPEEPDTVFIYRVETAQGSMIVEFTVTKSGQIYSVAQQADPGQPK